jgi:hypothetical protein
MSMLEQLHELMGDDFNRIAPTIARYRIVHKERVGICTGDRAVQSVLQAVSQVPPRHLLLVWVADPVLCAWILREVAVLFGVSAQRDRLILADGTHIQFVGPSLSTASGVRGMTPYFFLAVKP